MVIKKTYFLEQKIQDLIRDVSFFNGIPKESLMETITHLNVRKHSLKQTILLENSCQGSVYFIADGWLRILTYREKSNDVYDIYCKGEIMGAMSVLEGTFMPIEAVVVVPSKIWSIPAREFFSLLNTEPELGIRLARLMSKRLRRLNHYFRIKEVSSVIRVACLLLQLAEHGEQLTKRSLSVPHFTHREISILTGLSRETVTRSLTKLENRRLILRRGAHINILDIHALQEMARPVASNLSLAPGGDKKKSYKPLKTAP